MAEQENPSRESEKSPAGRSSEPTPRPGDDQPAAKESPASSPESPAHQPPASHAAQPAPAGSARPSTPYGGREGGGRFRDRDRRGEGGDRGRFGRPGRGGRDEEGESPFEERVVKINRCATVVKGGRRFSFSALVVLGDRQGSVGIGFGKANEVPPAVEKAIKDAKKNFVKVSLKGNTVPHQISGECRTTKVVLVPAAEGTGVIAGSAVRAVVECAGIKDLLTKVYGSTNPINVVKATLDALKKLRTSQEVTQLRGVEVMQ